MTALGQRPGGTGTRGVASSQLRFSERARSRRRRPWRRALAVVLVAAVVAALGWVVGWSPLLSVDAVRVSGATGTAAESLRERAGVAPGTPLARIDTDAVADRVRGDVTVAEVSVRRAWPRTLTVDVVRRVPAIVARNPQGRLEVVDREGVVFGAVKAAPAGVPVVTASGPKGMTADALRAALALVEALPPDLAGKVTAITVSSADLVTFRLGATSVVWGGGEESERKVALLRVLLRTKASVIDVSAPDTPVTR